MKIAIVSLPSNKCSQQLQYSPVADVMSHNQFQLIDFSSLNIFSSSFLHLP